MGGQTPLGMPSVPLEPNQNVHEENGVRSFANLAVVTEDKEQVGGSDHTILVGVKISAIRQAPVIAEHVQNVRRGHQSIVIDVSGTRSVVVRLLEALGQVLSRDADRAGEGLADRSVEVDAT